MVEEHRCDAEFRSIELCEDAMCIIGTIVVAYSSVIAPNDEMRTAIILTHECMEDGFTRPGIAHSGRKHTKYYTISRVVVLQQDLIATHTNDSRDIVTLGIAHQGMQIQAIYYF